MRYVLALAAAFLMLPLTARADCNTSGSMPEGSTCTVSSSCSLSGAQSEGNTCSSCSVTSSSPDACVSKFANTNYSRYCSTDTGSDTSWTEIWCAPPGDNTGTSSGCATAGPTVLALLGLGFLLRRRRVAQAG